MFTHVLLPIDGSELSQRAVDAGIDVASRYGATITAFVAEAPAPPPVVGQGAVGHVRRMEEHRRRAAERAQALLDAVKAKAATAGVPCGGFCVHTARIVPAILDAAQDCGCDLIVMGTHVEGRLRDLLVPSVARGVMAHAGVPVLVVH